MRLWTNLVRTEHFPEIEKGKSAKIFKLKSATHSELIHLSDEVSENQVVLTCSSSSRSLHITDPEIILYINK